MKVIDKAGLEPFVERISRNGVIVAVYRRGGFRKRCLKLDLSNKSLYWKDDRSFLKMRKRLWPLSDVVSISNLGTVQRDSLVKSKWNVLRDSQLHIVTARVSSDGGSTPSSIHDVSPRGSFAFGGGSDHSATSMHCLSLRLRSRKYPTKGKIYQIFMESCAEAKWFYSHFTSLVLHETGRMVAVRANNTSIIASTDSAYSRGIEGDDDNFSVDTYNTLATSTSMGEESFHPPSLYGLGSERASFVRPQTSTFQSTLYR